jgi:polysaccharide deacetylase family protein (PEP-CTERM system associated)
MIVNALSIDVEDYYHAAVFRIGAKRVAGGHVEHRVEQSVERVLALLSHYQTSATFFTLGEIAAAHPAVVRRIAAERHEIACHGDRHEDVCRLTPREFRDDIRRAKARLEDLVGDSVIGYRAPNFSIRPGQSWAYEVLVEEGFHYDSSSYPIFHDRYGAPGAPRFPYRVWGNGSARLVEFPVGTTRLLGVNLPIGGGGYFRLLPLAWTRRGIRRVNVGERAPVMFYVHPWELDPDPPRPPMAWRHRFRLSVGVEGHTAKLACLLRHVRFGRARDVLEGLGLAPAIVPQRRTVGSPNAGLTSLWP